MRKVAALHISYLMSVALSATNCSVPPQMTSSDQQAKANSNSAQADNANGAREGVGIPVVQDLTSQISGHQLRLNWSTVPEASSYEINWGIKFQSPLEHLDVSQSPGLTLTDLVDGPYRFDVYAITPKGRSKSTSIEVTLDQAVSTAPTETPPPASTPPLTFTLSSSAFLNNQPFPALYVAKGGGGNQSPPLQWTNAPSGTGSFAIQMIDLDFQTPHFIHWLITNIPAPSTKIPAAIPAGNNLAQPLEAKGANQPKAYAGPNPPALHRYEITIYAIKQGETLNLGTNSQTNKTELETKSVARSVLTGTSQ